MKTRNYRISSRNIILNIDRSEILRYLGYKNDSLEEDIDNAIEEALDLLRETAELKYIYRRFKININNNIIKFANTPIKVESKNLKNHLLNCSEAVIMAVTLGFRVEEKIRLFNRVDLEKGIIYEACGAELVEKLCDYAEDIIEKEARLDKLNITSRYSPGYGDLKLEVQRDIITTLDAQKKIGLSVSDSYILIPRKSVTAIIGFTKEDEKTIKTCKDCKLYESCKYKKEGESACVR